MTEKLKKMIDLSKKMNNKEFLAFKSILEEYISKNELNELDNHYSQRAFGVSAAKVFKPAFLNESISELYEDHLNKISSILQNEELKNRIGNINILFHGVTGSGKTTLVKKICELNQNYQLVNKSFENLISPKLGQTQLNILALANELNHSFMTQKAILFIDELDSVVNNRSSSNDVAEHARIVATFIKFMDLLSSNIVIFAATNLITSLDEAITRRFNIKVEGRLFGINKFFDFYLNENNAISTYNKNQLIKITNEDAKFTLSDLKEFEKNVEIDNATFKNHDIRITFIKMFQNKINTKRESFSSREKTIFSKGGVNV